MNKLDKLGLAVLVVCVAAIAASTVSQAMPHGHAQWIDLLWWLRH